MQSCSVFVNMNTSTPNQNSRCKRRVSIKFILLSFLTIVIAALILLMNITGSLCGCEGDPKDNPVEAKIFVGSEIGTVLQVYKIHTGSYPTTQQGLQALITQPTGVNGWNGPYFNTKGVPLDPWGHPYHYAYPSTHGQPTGKYDCWSLGLDGIDGTADDIGNWQH